MVDVVDKATRSRMMSGIRSKDTKPEILTRKALHKKGYRYSLDSEIKIPGQKRTIKPDIVLRNRKVAIFVHGCYFHQHQNCKLAYSDRNYTDFWLTKFKKNKERDERVTNQLLAEGWRVVIIWECATREAGIFENTIKQLDNWIRSSESEYFESGFKKV